MDPDGPTGPEVDRSVVAGRQTYSPIQEANAPIEDPPAREFLPMIEDAITLFDSLWEPEITAQLASQVQALVNGDTDPAKVGKALAAVADGLHTSGRSYYP